MKNNNRFKARRKMIIKRRVMAMIILGTLIGLVIYVPVKIKHNTLLKKENIAFEKFNSEINIIQDYKNVKEQLVNIYTSDSKLAEVEKLMEETLDYILNGMNEKVNESIDNLKKVVNEISEQNEKELEERFNKINEDKLQGFNDEELKEVNSIIKKYNDEYKARQYKSARDTLTSLQGYIEDTKKIANERRIKENYEQKSSENPSLREPRYVNGILLVNKENGLPDTFAPGESVEARNAFEKMKSDAALEGIYLNAFSTYRGYWTQNTLYNNYVLSYGKEPTDTFSAKPGFSEHQTGLAFDIGGVDRSLWAEEGFRYTKEAEWLRNNAHKYGFILRYPEGKEWKTGYMFESWHYRYVGIEHSKNFNNNDLTLEEYLGM